MKRIIICLFLFIGTQQAWSQNYIFLLNQSRIVIDGIKKIDAESVTYTSLGNPHELKIRQINYIRLGDTLLTFDKQNRPVYYHDKIPAEVTEPEKVNNDKPADPPAEKKTTVIKNEEAPLKPVYDSLYTKRDVNIVFFPLALVEPDMALRAGAEFQLGANSSLQTDVAFIYRSWETLFEDHDDAARGMAVRLEYRHYSLPGKSKSRFYMGPQGMFKFKRVPDFNWLFNNIETKYIGGLNFKFGFVSNTESTFYLDVYSGFGLRFENGGTLLVNSSSGHVYPNALLGFNAGIRLNRF
jgi:hypothetical protein